MPDLLLNQHHYICEMAEDLNITISTDKTDQYQSLIPQIEALLQGEPDLIANLANITAALKEQFKWLWVGFYLVKDNELVLGPFQGPVACTRIAFGKGVCGAAWQQEKTLIVPDVDAFPGHIACSSLSCSEIVVPVFYNENVVAVLDIDSEDLNLFDEVDATYLEQIVKLVNFK
ncbi:MAG: msrC [Mucilaginibacter sp.]|nr:msrC [Mucilaginibacter sp.]